MQVQANDFNLLTNSIYRNKINFRKSNYNAISFGNLNKTDVFERNNVSLSFEGNNKPGRQENLMDKLGTIGMVGAPLLLGITAGLLMSDESFDPSIFDDAQISVDTSEKSLSFGDLSADADDGVFSVKDTPIDIRPERFDYCDPENGIYTNFDGSVDIDLLNGKYIDKENGIFVDQQEGISTFVDAMGNAKHFAIPIIFRGSSMSGGSHYDPNAIIAAPPMEDEGKFIPELISAIKHSPLFEKFFAPKDNEQVKDMFDRDIVKATGDRGESYISTTLMGALTSINGEGIESLNDGKFQKYLNEQIAQHNFNNEVSFGIDIDGDGKIDATLIDVDGDGKFDAIDIDGDGIIDGTLVDVDGDGQYDGIDVDGDGIPDIKF